MALNLLDDLDRIVRAAENGDHLTTLEILALSDAYTREKGRSDALESALDIAQTMIEARPAVTGRTEPLIVAKAA